MMIPSDSIITLSTKNQIIQGLSTSLEREAVLIEELKNSFTSTPATLVAYIWYVNTLFVVLGNIIGSSRIAV